MYKRVVLKLSGEALKGQGKYGIDPKTVLNVAKEIKSIYDLGIEIIVIVGAGNLWRGKTAEEMGMDRAQADYIGMLGTVMNGLALQDSLETLLVPTRVMTAFSINSVAETYIRRRAIRHLEKGRVIIIAGGTGSPFFSTDTAASLRGAELSADIILMAKNGVDGVFDKDPKTHSDAKMYDSLSHKMILENKLGVMDMTAASMCLDNKLDVIVFNMNIRGNIKKAATKEKIGSIVKWEV